MMGGYMDSSGLEVLLGRGFPLREEPDLCAESLLIFLKQWSHLVLAAEEEEEKARDMNAAMVKIQKHRASAYDRASFLTQLTKTGHSREDVENLLEGRVPLRPEILQVPDEGQRYRIDDNMRRAWELKTRRHWDLLETVDEFSRDLGPYMHLNLLKADELKEVWSRQAKDSWCLINPTMVAKAAETFQVHEDDASEVASSCGADSPQDASKSFGLRLADFPPELVDGPSPSRFVRFFSEEKRLISLQSLQGLPPLPWSLGSDDHNTVIVDVKGVGGSGIAPFHCMFTNCSAQPHRACIVPLGDPMTSSFIVCPKYQPLQVSNGDRLICQQWAFEIRIEPTAQLHRSCLSLWTDEGTVFRVPMEGCHVGAGQRSRRLDQQPVFPQTKFALKTRLRDMSPVHVAFHYNHPMDRWTVVDHSPDPLGTLLFLKTGVAYPLSDGQRIKIGPLILEVALQNVSTG
jgi:hypothetical protein